MAKGVKTGGRKKGTPNKATAEVAKAVADSGMTPLQFMLDVMRGTPPPDADAAAIIAFTTLRFEAAKAAAPYVHPKLSSIEHSGSISRPFEDQSDDQLVEAMNRDLSEAGFTIQ
jgi:hypothetical protein